MSSKKRAAGKNRIKNFFSKNVRLKKRSGRSVSRKTKKLEAFRYVLAISGIAVLVVILSVLLFHLRTERAQRERRKNQNRQQNLPEISIQVKLLTPNKYSRPQLELKEVKGVVVHYTANPGTDAMSNRNYFNNLPKINKGKKKKTYASSHFIIGLEGQIIQCVPLEEMAYASNDRNVDTISIECCHPDKSGRFNKATYETLKELVAYLCIRFHLSSEDVIRHYDVTGKMCPKYFVKHEDKWIAFKSEVENLIESGD